MVINITSVKKNVYIKNCGFLFCAAVLNQMGKVYKKMGSILRILL